MTAPLSDSNDHLVVNENCVGIVRDLRFVPQQRTVFRRQGQHIHSGLALNDQ